MDNNPEYASKQAGTASFVVGAISTAAAVICLLTFPFVFVGVIGAIGLAIKASDWRPSIVALIWAIVLGLFEWQYVMTSTIGFG